VGSSPLRNTSEKNPEATCAKCASLNFFVFCAYVCQVPLNQSDLSMYSCASWLACSQHTFHSSPSKLEPDQMDLQSLQSHNPLFSQCAYHEQPTARNPTLWIIPPQSPSQAWNDILIQWNYTCTKLVSKEKTESTLLWWRTKEDIKYWELLQIYDFTV
jgi:hypothetical protein